MQILECDPRMLCQTYDYSSGDQFVNAENCYSPQNDNGQSNNFEPQGYSQSQMCYEPCQPAQCYQENSGQNQQYEACCDPCPQTQQCEPLGPQQMPTDQNCQQYICPPPCSPMCSPFSRKRYVQPLRRESCKPVIRYQRPCVPMTSETIYNKSFDLIDSKTAASCRMPPVMPSGQLRANCGEFAKDTVTKVSRLGGK